MLGTPRGEVAGAPPLLRSSPRAGSRQKPKPPALEKEATGSGTRGAARLAAGRRYPLHGPLPNPAPAAPLMAGRPARPLLGLTGEGWGGKTADWAGEETQIPVPVTHRCPQWQSVLVHLSSAPSSPPFWSPVPPPRGPGEGWRRMETKSMEEAGDGWAVTRNGQERR